MALRWARLGTAKPPPRFPSRLGNTSTQNMDNECFQPPLQAKMSYPGDPALGTNWKTLVEEFDEKIPLQGSKHYMSLENSSLCMGRDLRSCPGAPAVARGMNIWSSQLCEMVWKKFRKVTFFFLVWPGKREMHLPALCCPGRFTLGAACTRQHYQRSAHLSALNT